MNVLMHVVSNCYSEDTTLQVNDFYKEVSVLLAKEDITEGPKNVRFTLEDNSFVEYNIVLRSGTKFIKEEENTLSIQDNIGLKECFLTCVDPSKNAYKFYKLLPLGDSVKVSYGRMGVNKGELFGERSYIYPNSMFWIKYHEKISKGYVDRSDIYLTKEEDTNVNKPIKRRKQNISGLLFEKLYEFANDTVKRFEVKVPLSTTILTEAKKLLSEMRKADTVDSFNKNLLDLISILQRPVRTGDGRGVKNLLASSLGDKESIINREDDLIQAMESRLLGINENKELNSFSNFNITVKKATEKQKENVISLLDPKLKNKVTNVYRIIPKKQQQIFDEYVKENNIKEIKYLWHGSRNANWLSIIINSLKLNPDAIITGKMYGQGIYFAPSSLKSWGYTDYHGSYWRKGNSDTAYMGLYATAYGKPLKLSSWSGRMNYENEVKNRKFNCLHVLGGNAIRHDEIVYYSEKAMVLNYIVEFN